MKNNVNKLTYYKINRVRCLRCGDELCYEHNNKNSRGPGRMMTCNCGSVSLDPAAVMYRIVLSEGGTWDDVEDLSEIWLD
ncbi:hypothetical protein [Bacillus testis]|uniref:hypothetical protein n=1 Tax=Bacillus testis TaxID=1622072 RepID=UPI00067E8DC1|nr:hypothetical protein [Bacillus testis]